jgi:hypothetical protein
LRRYTEENKEDFERNNEEQEPLDRRRRRLMGGSKKKSYNTQPYANPAEPYIECVVGRCS